MAYCGIVAVVVLNTFVCAGGELCGVAEVALGTLCEEESYDTKPITIAGLSNWNEKNKTLEYVQSVQKFC
jgi:hypothetical protein